MCMPASLLTQQRHTCLPVKFKLAIRHGAVSRLLHTHLLEVEGACGGVTPHQLEQPAIQLQLRTHSQ